jgi:hypothetical protein
MDRTVSRRSEPSSRTAFMGEQPNPWDVLPPQDAMSRHRNCVNKTSGFFIDASFKGQASFDLFYGLLKGPFSRLKDQTISSTKFVLVVWRVVVEGLYHGSKLPC